MASDPTRSGRTGRGLLLSPEQAAFGSKVCPDDEYEPNQLILNGLIFIVVTSEHGAGQ